MNYLFPTIASNLLGYDMIIILLAVGTMAYYLFVLKHSNKVFNAIHTQGYRPDDVLDGPPRPPTRAETKQTRANLRNMRETSDKYYSMFSNLASIFPLLGILGTVVSLIPMVQDISSMQANFFVALTSTLWGLVFSIFFRVMDGVLSPRIERNNRGIDDYLEKLDSKLEVAHEEKRNSD